MNSSLAVVILLIMCSLLSPTTLSQDPDTIGIPFHETAPNIDGMAESPEWNGSVTIDLTIEGNDATIFMKHDRDNIYVGFDIQDGHNSVFPDTRIFFDTHHDAVNSPQEDDYQLYINPDNGGLQERQGDGGGWQQVAIQEWDGAWNEDGTDHWSTEYVISSGKFTNFTGNETMGFALLVWGNLPTSSSTWPDDADMDDPSTWGDVRFLNWTEETNETKPDDPPDPDPGGNGTDPNGTDGGSKSEDDEFLVIPIPAVLGGMVCAVILVRRKRSRKEQDQLSGILE